MCVVYGCVTMNEGGKESWRERGRREKERWVREEKIKCLLNAKYISILKT